MLPAILASIVVMSKPPHKANSLLLRSLYMGLGIGSMHYIDMMAMQMNAIMAYDGWYFSLSIVVAVGLTRSTNTRLIGWLYTCTRVYCTSLYIFAKKKRPLGAFLET